MTKTKLHPVLLDSDSTDSDTGKYHVNPHDDLNHKVTMVKGREHRPLALADDEYGEYGQDAGGQEGCKIIARAAQVVFSNLLSVSSILIGIIYLGNKNCPAEPLLTPLLIFGGILGIMLSAVTGCCWANSELAEGEDPQMCFGCRLLSALLSVVKIGLFFYLGTLLVLIWVKGQTNQCDPVLLYYSVCQIAVVLIYVFLYIIHEICAFVAKKASSKQIMV